MSQRVALTILSLLVMAVIGASFAFAAMAMAMGS